MLNSWKALGVFWIASVFYLSLGSVSGPIDVIGIDKFYHLITYCFLSLWFLQLSKKTGYILFVVVFFVLMGVLLEFLQAMTPHRMFEYNDMWANAIGVVIGCLLSFTKLGGVLDLLAQRQIVVDKN